LFELLKLLWDLVMVRDAYRRGLLTWRVWAVGIGLVLFLYGTGIPVGLLWDKYPQYAPVFICVLALDGVAALAVAIWGWRLQARLRAAK
jgi:hypothetical protein